MAARLAILKAVRQLAVEAEVYVHVRKFLWSGGHACWQAQHGWRGRYRRLARHAGVVVTPPRHNVDSGLDKEALHRAAVAHSERFDAAHTVQARDRQPVDRMLADCYETGDATGDDSLAYRSVGRFQRQNGCKNLSSLRLHICEDGTFEALIGTCGA